MSLLRRQGEKTTPDFIEDDFISALETGLNRTVYYRHKRVQVSRISQSDENDLGYDGVLTTIVPFYLQFKRSDFYTPHYRGRLIQQRRNVLLPVDKGFFAFELLKKDNKYDQHNAMYKLSRYARAAYVAPMFYKSADLDEMKSYGANFIPSYYDDVIIYDFHRRRSSTFRNALLFKNSITIPPHAEITDTETSHHYSYCRDYKIGFHSDPINLEDSNTQSLYQFMDAVFNQEKSQDIKNLTEDIFNQLPACLGFDSQSDDFRLILEASLSRISITDSDTKFQEVIEQLQTLDKLLIIEDILFQYFGIRQFIKYEEA